jgi:hypothetical protein
MEPFRANGLRRIFDTHELKDIRDIMKEKGLHVRLEELDARISEGSQFESIVPLYD